MILTEYDEEKNTKTWFEDGIEEGKKEKAVETAENLFMGKMALYIQLYA